MPYTSGWRWGMCSTPSANRGSIQEPPTLVNGTTECHTYGETAIIIIVLSEFLYRQNFFHLEKNCLPFCPLLSCTVGEISIQLVPMARSRRFPQLFNVVHTQKILKAGHGNGNGLGDKGPCMYSWCMQVSMHVCMANSQALVLHLEIIRAHLLPKVVHTQVSK